MKNKKGVIATTTLLIIVAVIVGILILGGGLASFSLSSIPGWFYILLGIILIFMLGRKK